MNNDVKQTFIVTGHANHGKDTVSAILASLINATFISSSEAVAEQIIFPQLKPLYGYLTVEECFVDRVNHRKEWYDLIHQFNTPDLTRLTRLIFGISQIYCGIRNITELRAIIESDMPKPCIIWVDALERLPKESADSITISAADADYIVDNNKHIPEENKRVAFLQPQLENILFLLKHN